MTHKISCLMPTYNRITHQDRLLDEAVLSFLQQDLSGRFGDVGRELIICNDTPGQTIQYNHPLVRVINLPDRFNGIGHKFNYIAQQAQGDYLCPWDDDDISLPWRLSHSLNCLLAQGHDYYSPKGGWIDDTRQLRYEDRVFLAATMFSRNLWLELGGYPEIPSGADMGFYQKVPPNRSLAWSHIDQEWAYYIYRWYMGPGHLSSGQDGYNRIGKQPIIPGIFQIRPLWTRDYMVLTGHK